MEQLGTFYSNISREEAFKLEAFSILVHNPFQLLDTSSYVPLIIRKVCSYTLRKPIIYNHAVSVVLYPNGRYYVIHAVTPRVEIVRFDVWEARNNNRKMQFQSCPIDDIDQVRIRAEEMVDTPYDRLNLVDSLIFLLTKRRFGRGVWLGRTQEWSKNAVQCYECRDRIFNKPKAYMAMPEQ